MSGEVRHGARHRIAVAAFNGLPGFGFGIAREVLGFDRTNLVPNWYEFQLCRAEDGRLLSDHGLEIFPCGTLDDLLSADTVLLPGWRDHTEPPPQPLQDALRQAHHRGVRLVTICTGVFALAHAGLLRGRTVTTHWLYSEALRQTFPGVRVEDDALYLHDTTGPGQISTSAGSAAGLDLCLALVRQDFGLKVANTIARRMVAPTHREGGQSQYVESPVGAVENDVFGPVLDWMVERLDESLAMDDVARKFGYSLRTFQRRFKDVTGNSPHIWLVQQRVAKARELLESSQLSVEQVADRAGFGTSANLRKHLARHLGTTPRAYRSTFRA